MKTIKQIADEIGVSKEKVKYQVRKLPGEFVEKQGNITYITDSGMAILKGLLVGKKVGNSPFQEYLTGEFTRLFPSDEQKRITELEVEVERLKWQIEFERASYEEKRTLQQQRVDEAIAYSKQVSDDCEKWRNLMEREQQLRLAEKAETLNLQLADGGEVGRIRRAWRELTGRT